MPTKDNLILKTGQRVLTVWDGMKDFGMFVQSIMNSFKSLRFLRLRSINDIVINQTLFTGVHALTFVIFIALLIGGIVIIQAMTQFPKYGIDSYVGNLLVIIVAREVGPLLTAVIVISRSGSAITAEIATQKQNKEILAMEIMGIDTSLYIVFPRIIASILAIFSLMVIFDIVAFIGGYIISQLQVFIAVDVFAEIIIEAVSLKDLFSTLLKSIIYGILIPLISCYYGFKPNSQFEIPIFVSKAVIRTLVIIFVINGAISVLFYL